MNCCSGEIFIPCGSFFRDWWDFLQQFYDEEENGAKVDRIIFVESARSIELPYELIAALISRAMSGKRGRFF